MSTSKTIVRNKRFFDDEGNNGVTVQTKATFVEHSDEVGKWYNCIYITFRKEDYPNLKYPETREGYFKKEELSFNYDDCDLANLDWHRGITYYSEVQHLPNNEIIVKAGADYQHLCDDHYQLEDNGESILEANADKLYKQFTALVDKCPA